MSNPRYIPRTFATEPDQFGRVLEISWRSADSSDLDQVARLSAAQLQHRICYAIVALYLPTSSMKTVAALARSVGISYDRLQRVLRGRAVMQLEDIGRLTRLVGPRLELWSLSPSVYASVEQWRRASDRERAALQARKQSSVRRAATGRYGARGL